MDAKIEKIFRNKVSWYSFILCMLVVCIHAQNMYIFTEPVAWINRSLSFFIERIACFAVPGFFMCSAFLFYRNLTWNAIAGKLKRRFFRLVLPFFLWNFIYYMVNLGARRVPYLDSLFNTPVPFDFRELFAAVVLYKYNPVFWFMLYLIVFSFLSPLLYLLLRGRWTGIITLGFVLLFNFNVIRLSFLTAETADILNWSLYYLIGCYAALHLKEAAVPERKLLPVLVLLGGICASYILAYVCGSDSWTYIYKSCGALLIWFLVWSFRLPDVKAWMKNTFFIYAVHQMLALFINKIANVLLGNSMYAGLAVFLAIPVTVVIFCYYMGRFLSRYAPPVWKALSGARD